MKMGMFLDYKLTDM